MSASGADAHIVLACSSDVGYAPYAAAMLHSALTRTPEARFTIHYLQDPDFPDTERARLKQALAPFGPRADLRFITVPDTLVEGLPLFQFMKPGLIRPVMWYRVFLPQLLPDTPKVLYLDCDTLVTDSLLPLWQTAVEGKAIAAVTNPFWEGYNEGVAWPSVCGLPKPEAYFNSGVMLMNLDYWRGNDVTHRVTAHGIANAGWLRFGDQDSLNALLHAARAPLHPRYNLMRIIIMTSDARRVFGHAPVSEAIRHPAILHFEGTTKPWVDATGHPYGRAWARTAKQLPWPATRTPPGLNDIENFLTRRDWVRLRRLFRRLRSRLPARKGGA